MNRRVNLPDFIEKKRSALRLLEPADAPFMRAGERAFFVAEQFAFQKCRRECGAMHRHEWLLRARTQLVNRLRHKFLARAAFAANQNRRARRRDLLDDFKNFPHFRRFTDNVFQAKFGIELLPQGNIFRFQVLMPQCACDPHFQLVNLQPSFCDVIVRAALHCVHCKFLRSVSRHQNADWRLR